MFVRKPAGSGRGLVHTTELRPCAPLAAAVAVLAASTLVALLPGGARAASFQAIQANIQEKQAALEHARAKEGVLTSDISALSKRIRTLTRQIGSLRRRE